MKLCTSCGEVKDDGEFSRKGAKLQGKCKECQRSYHRIYYARNKARFIEKNRRNKNRQRQRLRAILWEAKQSPCVDCGLAFHPWVMEFDHRGGTIKDAAVANLVGKGCPDSHLRAEIEKCDVVCANCHRLRTYSRLMKAGQVNGQGV